MCKSSELLHMLCENCIVNFFYLVLSFSHFLHVRCHYFCCDNFSNLKFSPLQNESYITLHDLKGSKLSGSAFNMLFNLNKFMAYETRDPVSIREVDKRYD